MYLYRAVDSEENTIDFYLSKTRNHKALQSFHGSKPCTITIDKNFVYLVAITKLKNEKKVPLGTQIRQIKYLNNVVEQEHRFIKKRVRSMLGFKSFGIATCILAGVTA